MKSRLHKIEITNFKAFREFSLGLEGRHLLVYGPNGSGKSSLYWALYTFLQSAQKPRGFISKYFDADHPEKLLNIHEDPVGVPGKIALTLRHDNGDETMCISQTQHDTFRKPVISKGDLASDFVTYRFFFGFSDFSNSDTFDLWPLFEKEILPSCVAVGGDNPLECWNKIKSGDPNPRGARGTGGSNAYYNFKSHTQAFAAILPGIVDSISDEAQKFYDAHFSGDDSSPIKLILKVTTLPLARGTNGHNFNFTRPKIGFGILVDGHPISKPQSYLNEAKLTQVALSVRFAASLVNLDVSDLKLLVLDDLLVSLDMSNRMRVVDILLSEQFADYQKIIMTHDLGFFRELRRVIGNDHTDWCFRRLQPHTCPTPNSSAAKAWAAESAAWSTPSKRAELQMKTLSARTPTIAVM